MPLVLEEKCTKCRNDLGASVVGIGKIMQMVPTCIL